MPETYLTHSSEETRGLGVRLASRLASGDILLLRGPLGSGKTCLVTGLAQGLGLDAAEVHSPSFGLVHEHPGTLPLFHMDLYRLSTPADLDSLGLEEYFQRPGICAVEWPELLVPQLPRPAWTLAFEYGGAETQRRITVQPPEGTKRP